MSIKASKWARVQNLHKTPKQVLVALAMRANEKKGFFCFPGQKLIAEETGLSERTVRYALLYLEEMGLITREQRRRRDGYRTSDTITLNVDDRQIAYIHPYGQWRKEQNEKRSHRQLLQSHRQQLPTSPAAAAGPSMKREGFREVEERSSSSTSSTPDARENDELLEAMTRTLVEATRMTTSLVPSCTDQEILEKMEQVMFSADLPFQDSPQVQEANLELVTAIQSEFQKRFGGVS